jgi:hypothetical protein
MRMIKQKVKLNSDAYLDWGCRVICKCGHPEYFNKTHFCEDDTWRCDKCDRPLVLVHGGIPYYVGEAVFPKEQRWGGGSYGTT